MDIQSQNVTVAQLLSVDQAAAALGVRPATIRKWLFVRKIVAVRLSGKCVRIPTGEVARLIAAHTIPAVPVGYVPKGRRGR